MASIRCQPDEIDIRREFISLMLIETWSSAEYFDCTRFSQWQAILDHGPGYEDLHEVLEHPEAIQSEYRLIMDRIEVALNVNTERDLQLFEIFSRKIYKHGWIDHPGV